jgi:sugar lactone lactonase YvrE
MKISRGLRQPNRSVILSTFLILLFGVVNNSHAQQKPQVVAIIDENDIIPEGIAFDEKSKTIFLSSIHKNKILAISPDGFVSDFVPSNKDGIKQVLGMKVVNGQLWACNNTPEHDTVDRHANLHVYDLASGKLLRRITVKGKHLFNDFYMMRNGDAYVTDSDGAGVYLIKKGSDKAEPFIKGGTIPYPNGITATADEKKIIVSTGGGQGIVSIDLETKAIKSITHAHYFIIGADGLYRYKNKLIAVQNVTFPEGIVEMQLSDDGQTITDIKHLAVGIPEFDTPTTGVIVGDEFYFIANSQLFQLIGNNGKIKNPEKLKETSILKISLN